MSQRADDTGSLPVALLLTLCALGLSAVLLPTTLTQVAETRQTVSREHARGAAVTGIEVAAAAVDAAYGDTPTAGDRSLLPCGPIEGSAGAEAAATYRVTLRYFDDDPAVSGAAVLPCAEARAGGTAPRYVQLTSTGTTTGGTPSRRTLRGAFPLQSGAVGNPGTGWGPQFDEAVHPRLVLAWSPRPEWSVCLDPATGRPTAGQTVWMQDCQQDVEENGYKQFWYYRSDLTLATVASLLADDAMCLDAGTPLTAGAQLRMQPCETPVPPRQRWYYTEHRNFEVAAPVDAAKGEAGKGDVALSGYCLNVAQPETPGSALVLGTGADCRSPAYTTRQTFSMYTKVGPGQAGSRPLDCTEAAGYPCTLTQLVNNGMPNRCLEDFTGFMANLECVQHPDPAKIRWGQLWRLPKAADGPTGATGPLVTVDPQGKTFCLTVSASSYPSQEACDPAKPSTGQTFTVYRDTGDEFTMYRIVAQDGRCLTHPNALDPGFTNDWQFYWTQASYHWKARVSACVNTASDPAAQGSFFYQSVLKRQKWNAPALLPAGASGSVAAGPVAGLGPYRLRTVVELDP